MNTKHLLKTATLTLLAGHLHAANAGEQPPQTQEYMALVTKALPNAALAEEAIAGSLNFRSASLNAQQKASEGELTRIGQYEWETSASMRMRKDKELATNNTSQDYELGLFRTLRLPSKARLDEQMSGTFTEISELTRLDGWHETARLFNASWFDCVQSMAALDLAKARKNALALFASQQQKRLDVGEISVIEFEQARLELQQSEQDVDTYSTEATLQAAALAAGFPLFAQMPKASACFVPVQSIQALAEPIQPPDQHWAEQMVAENHGLQLTQMEATLSRMESERSAADKTPDPTVGLTFAMERDNAEQIIGLQVGIPLSGQARNTQAQLASLKYSEAALNGQIAEAQAKLLAQQTLLTTRVALRRAQQKQNQAAVANNLLDKLNQAFMAGEIGHIELKMARDQALAANSEAVMASIEALRNLSLILIDSHVLLSPPEGKHH